MGSVGTKSTAPSLMEKNKQRQCEFNYFEEHICFNEQLIRIQGEQLKKNIHRSMVALTFLDANNKINTASGVLISRDTVLTAAHNVFNKELSSENSDFKIYIGANGVAEEYYQIEALKYPEQYQTCSQTAKLPHDYAIMKLKRPVQFNNFLTLSLVCDECLKRQNEKIKLSIFGFPSAYPVRNLQNVRVFQNNFQPLDQLSKKIRLYQYGLSRENKIAQIDGVELKISYGISTLPGQSGSPVIVDDSIIAIHIGGDKSQLNFGRIVDTSLLKSLWKWTKQLNLAIFQLKSENACPHIKEKLQKMKLRLTLVFKDLIKVDLSEYASLLQLNLNNNKIVSIDLSHCPYLTNIDLSYNQLQQINTSKNANIISLNLFSNQLQTIDVSVNTKLTQLWLSSNRITKIDTSKNTELNLLGIQNNKLMRIRVCVSEKVDEERYITLYYFSFSDQQSAVCRVQLLCQGQGQTVREKAIRIVDKWMQKYSSDRYNYYNCTFSFLAF